MKKWLKNLFKSNKQKELEEARRRHISSIARDEKGKWIFEDGKPTKKPANLPLEDKWSEAKTRINKCHCEPGTCGCSSKTSPQKPASVKPVPKKPTTQKPVAKQTEKKEAIKKDIADTPLPKKPAPKKPVQKKAPKKD